MVSQGGVKAVSVGSKTVEVNCHPYHLLLSACTLSMALGIDLDPPAEFVLVSLLHCSLFLISIRYHLEDSHYAEWNKTKTPWIAKQSRKEISVST